MSVWHLLALLSVTQGGIPDSASTYEGIVQRAPAGDWHVVLAYPVTAAGYRARSLSLGRDVRMALPPNAMRDPGVYHVEASLCGARDFRARTRVLVQRGGTATR